MKVTLLFLAFFFSSFFSVSQKFAIAGDRNNVLFEETNNPITIVAENYSCKSLYIKVNNGQIKGSNGYYMYKPKSVGIANIIVFIKDKGKLKETGRNNFRVKYLVNRENAVFKIGPCGSNCIINKTVLQNQGYVRVDLENTDFHATLEVDSFIVGIISSKSGSSKYIKNIGGKINDEIKKEFRQINDNDIILFKSIYAKRPNGLSIELNPVLIFVPG